MGRTWVIFLAERLYGRVACPYLVMLAIALALYMVWA